jgi:hypothetical protein
MALSEMEYISIVRIAIGGLAFLAYAYTASQNEKESKSNPYSHHKTASYRNSVGGRTRKKH